MALSGAGARDFLQGLITNDIERLAPGRGLYAALLSPQGKVAHDFFLVEGDGAILLDAAAVQAEILLKKLKLYRLRAPVTIEARPQLGVYAGLGGRPAGRGVSFPDPRLEALGPRSIGARAEMPDFLPNAAAYHALRLELGVPEAGELEGIFALDAGLEELNAVAFDKGCYVGQELTSRMKHRSTARKRLLLVDADGALPAPGTEISDGTQTAGEIISAYGSRGFALVRLDRLAEMAAPLKAGEIPVALTRPKWLD